MREDLIKRIKENEDFEDASIDEILRLLIDESSLTEIVCCLDMLAVKEGTRVASFDWTGMTYPCGPQCNLDIPPPPWKLDKDGIKKLINEDKDIPILVPVCQDDCNKEDPDEIQKEHEKDTQEKLQEIKKSDVGRVPSRWRESENG